MCDDTCLECGCTTDWLHLTLSYYYSDVSCVLYGLAALADCSSNDDGVDTYTLATSCLYGTSELTKALHIYFLQHAYIAVDFIVASGAYQNTKYRRIMCTNRFHLMQ